MSDSGFPVLVRAELAALQPGVTPDAWLAAHPRDSFALFSHRFDDWPDDGGCARATLRDTLRDSAVVIRHAYFGVPGPDAGLALPEGQGATVARAHCTLTAVWVESPAPHRQHPVVTTDSIITLLSAKYGAGAKPGRERVFFGSGYWSPFLAWRDGPATILAAYDGRQEVGYVTRVLAVALLPQSTIGQRDRPRARDPWGREMVERAVHLAGATPAEAAPLLRWMQPLPSDSAPPGAEAPREIVTALRQWLDAATRRPPAQRAAALLAADIALGGERLRWSFPNDSAVRAALTPYGATFAYAPLGQSWLYSHGLRTAALAVDSSGPVADLALLSQLPGGLDDSGTCRGGAEAFRRVIAAGEPLLPRLEPRDQARVHVLLGDAYADAVGLADGITEYAEAATYAAEADGARAKAVAHYRRALALNLESTAARATWVKAWRLLAGLPPVETRFFCVYD